MPIESFPILYSFRRCPYAMRARLALLLTGQIVQLREVELRNKPEQLFAASAKGTVPVLVLPDGQVIDESLDIMRWALQLNDPWGCCLTETQAQLALIEQHDREFKPLLDRYKYPERYPELGPEEHQYNAMYWLKTQIETRLEKHTHLFGEQTSLADLAIMPFIRQCAAVNHTVFGREASQALQAWLASWLASPLFTLCMEKYSPWQAHHAAVHFGGPFDARSVGGPTRNCIDLS